MIQYCLASIILEDTIKKALFRLDSTFPAEGPKGGMTQLFKEMHFLKQYFLSLVAVLSTLLMNIS
jgi:hypothetical protein